VQAKILIIDDEPHIVKLVASRLEANGYDTIIASGGEEGLDKAARDKPDLILLDVLMPGIDGHQTLRELKARDETRMIPVIMFTAKGQLEDVEKAHEMGAVDYIVKPFNPVTLMEKISKTLGKR